jgi:hypothetical protein
MATIRYKTGHIPVAKTPTIWPPPRPFRKSLVINDETSWFVQGFWPGPSICSILIDDMLTDEEVPSIDFADVGTMSQTKWPILYGIVAIPLEDIPGSEQTRPGTSEAAACDAIDLAYTLSRKSGGRWHRQIHDWIAKVRMVQNVREA